MLSSHPWTEKHLRVLCFAAYNRFPPYLPGGGWDCSDDGSTYDVYHLGSPWSWDLHLTSTQFHRCGQLLLLLYFLWKFTFNMFWLSASSGGLALIKSAPTDDNSRCSQVGWTHPRLWWVWQRLEGESSLRLILFLISHQLLGASAEPSGREV